MATVPETLHIPFEALYDPRGEAFAIRKGDPDALNYFDNWIAQNWRSGWLEERHGYWFASTEWDALVADHRLWSSSSSFSSCFNN